jgi:hypothetical protein
VTTSDEHETPGTFRRILRELPRRRVALVLVVIIVNVLVSVRLRGQQILEERIAAQRKLLPVPYIGAIRLAPWYVAWQCKVFVIPPQYWTADEWRDTVWPWK